MKTFSRLLSEISQPNSEDELNFKEKHIIDPKDHPVSPDFVWSGAVDKDDLDGMKRYRKNKRLADYQAPEDEEVYEGVDLKRDMPGQEDNDVDNDGDKDFTDAQYKYRRHAQIKKYRIDETVYVIPEEILATEKNAFHTAAANAHKAGKKHFAFGGKKYPVTMSKDAADTFAGKGMNEKVTEPYAVGMAQAMKSTGDKPPLLKKTIRLAHKIAKGIEKNEAVAWSHNTYADYVAHNKAKGHQVIPKDLWHKLKKQNESSMDPVGQEDDDINNDGRVTKHDKYLHNRRKAISASIRSKIKEGFGAVTAAGGDYDEEESHQRYKKSNLSRKENVTLGDSKGLKIYAGKTKESQIQEDLDEAIEVSHDRYMRSHGKKARDSGQGSSNWMFTHKRYGDVDHNDKGEVHQAYGTLAGAKQSAKKWAKEHGHSTVYVMEEVDLDEATDPRSVRDELKSKGKHKEAGEHAYKHGLGRSYGQHFGMRSSKNNAEMEFHKGYDNAQAHESRAARLKNEEVEQIAELDKKTLGSYIKKAKTDVAGQAYQLGAKDPLKPKASWSKALGREKYIDKAVDRLTKEETDLTENFKAGAVKLNDGSSVTVKDQDAKLLNQLFKDLNTDNKKKMMKVAVTDRDGFNEILGFAREAL